MLALIPLLPFLGFLVNATLGRRLPKGLSGGIASLAMIASFGVSALVVWQLAGLAPEARVIRQLLYTWIPSGDLSLGLELHLDPLSALMILVVTGIGSLIHIYSTAYMHEEVDSEYARYFSYLNLFAAFMLVLVLGANFAVMFIGWEGVGLCSYLLIGFWFKKKSANDAGKKAFVVNRIGDYAFILGMLALFTQFGTLDFSAIASAAGALAPEAGFGILTVATLLLFVGATGKSAQIPLHTWLPDAMEGPTPVSALIHAATMVTAGVYMIGRNAVLFSLTPETMLIVAVIGGLTALMAATIGLVQHDIKRVLAYSTVSQLGLMFLAMGVGAFAAGIFHLYTHAFFKALLFLGSGAVIHALHGEQDIRNMGGLRRELPITYWTFLIGALAIAGVPLLAGFFSKDAILYETFERGYVLLWVVGALTSLLTATYMFRLVFLTFHGERFSVSSGRPAPVDGRRHDAPVVPQHPEEEEPAAHAAHPGRVAPLPDQAEGAEHHPAVSMRHGQAPAAAVPHPGHLHDAPPAMAFALIVLAIGSVLAGYVGLPYVMGPNLLAGWLGPVFAGALVPEVPHDTAAEIMLMGVATAIALAGIGTAWFLWLNRRDLADRLARSVSPVHRLLLNKYYVDEAYDAAIVHPVRTVSEDGLWRGFDVKVIDGAVNGTGALVAGGAMVLRRLQTGSVKAYAGSVVIGTVVILGYYLWR